MPDTTVRNLLDLAIAESHVPDEAGLRQTMVRGLQFLRSKKFDCSEATVTIDLVASQDSYDTADGIPGDLLSIEGVPVLIRSSGSFTPMKKEITIQDFRSLQSHVNIKGYPRHWCWFRRKLFIHPKPSGDFDLQIDYWRDCTRDEKTGVEITATSDADDFSNALFNEHPELIVSRTIYGYMLGKGSGSKQASEWKTLYREALNSALGVRDARKLSGAQVRWVF